MQVRRASPRAAKPSEKPYFPDGAHPTTMLFANLPLVRSTEATRPRNGAGSPMCPDKPDLLRARLWSGPAIDRLLDNLTHSVEPPARAFDSLLAPNDRRANLCVFNSEFHLLIEHIYLSIFLPKF